MNTCDDPRSYDYKRIYNKTPINKKRLVLFVLIDIIISLITLFISKKVIIVILINGLYYLLCLKYIIIFAIKIYQRVAPISIRSKCRFEPSCSNYMLQALEKYGLIKGLRMGINRLKRCNINGGGYDYP